VSATREIRVLNLVRSAAALLVVLGHVRLLFIEDYADARVHGPVHALLYATTSLGSEAVIVFFVLSGYFVGGGVIHRLRQGRFAWGDYASARLTRLWIVLIPALVLTLCIDLAGRALLASSDVYALPSSYAGIPSEPSYSVFTVLGNVAFLQGIFVPVLGSNGPLWSLAYEFWYYLLFPLLMVGMWKGQRLSTRLLSLFAAIVVCFITWGDLLLLFPCWLAGAVIAAQTPRIASVLHRMPPVLWRVLRTIAFPALLGTMIAAHESSLPSRSGAWLIALVAAGAIAVFVEDARWGRRLDPLFSRLSETAHSSYSLYAIHMPIVAILAAMIVPVESDRWAMSALSYLACIGVTLVLCVIAWAFALGTEARTDRVRKALSARRRKAVNID
jgi:peptidoglycan/LPS O-acetylase OafA/YrhL